jgi:hypothetical protein
MVKCYHVGSFVLEKALNVCRAPLKGCSRGNDDGTKRACLIVHPLVLVATAQAAVKTISSKIFKAVAKEHREQ